MTNDNKVSIRSRKQQYNRRTLQHDGAYVEQGKKVSIRNRRQK